MQFEPFLDDPTAADPLQDGLFLHAPSLDCVQHSWRSGGKVTWECRGVPLGNCRFVGLGDTVRVTCLKHGSGCGGTIYCAGVWDLFDDSMRRFFMQSAAYAGLDLPRERRHHVQFFNEVRKRLYWHRRARHVG